MLPRPWVTASFSNTSEVSQTRSFFVWVWNIASPSGGGDDIANVQENFRRLCAALDCQPADLLEYLPDKEE